MCHRDIAPPFPFSSPPKRDDIMIGDKTFLDATSFAKKLPDSDDSNSKNMPPSPKELDVKAKKRAYHQAWRMANRKHVRSWQHQYYWKNRERCLLTNRKHRYKNHPDWKAYMKEYMRKWRAEHPHYICPKEQMRRRKYEKKHCKK